MNQPVLDVRDLEVTFQVHGGTVRAVRGVSFHVNAGECLCVVGESGCGKSVSVQALMGLLPSPPARIDNGRAMMEGRDLLRLTPRERREIMGARIAMIFQDPLTSLNPTMTVFDQIAESLRLHTTMTAARRRERVIELLELVRIPEPLKRLKQYPHEFSGGMRQRVMIAMALACDPKVLIADEPTTALDVTIQAQILALIKDLSKRLGMATILITHDLGVVARMADRVAVMYAGRVVEEAPVDAIFGNPRHPYTIGLREAMPGDGHIETDPLRPIPGTPPDLFAPPPGCAFAARCPDAMVICRQRGPADHPREGGRVACWKEHPCCPGNAEIHHGEAVA